MNIVHQISKIYRQKSWNEPKPSIHLIEYPSSRIIKISQHNNQTIEYYSNIFNKSELNGREGWICGRGMTIKRNNNNQIECFCPPSLYGEYCQYYNDRITLIISLDQIPSELFKQNNNIIKILAFLFSNDDIIDYYVFHLPLILSKELKKKLRFNLIYSRPRILSKNFKVLFESYHLNSNSSIEFLGVWEYPIDFPFLPSYRLAKILKLNQNLSEMPGEHICKRSNPCLHQSSCHSILNDPSSFYCYCNNQSFGKYCQHLFHHSSSSLKCSQKSQMRPISSSKLICLCSNGFYGPTCHLNHTCVNNNPCGINKGKCYHNPDNVDQDFICICDKKYFGNRCQINSSMVEINFIDWSFVEMSSKFILSSIIQLCHLDNETLDLIIDEKRVYEGLPPLMTQIYHNDYYLPKIALIKFYHQLDLSNDYVANLKQSDYFILYVISSNVSLMNLTLKMNLTNYCPYTQTVFERNLSNASHLSQCKRFCS